MTKLALPQVIGHRGAAAYAPENTLQGLHSAADMGVKWVEIDVKLTQDGVPIVFHDDTLDRTTSGSGKVAETKWEDIRELDAGSWFGDSFIDLRIPTLEDALEVIINRGLGVNLEIKPCPGREKETAEVMLDHATRIWPEEDAPPLVSSFQHVSIETALDLAPGWPRALLLDEKSDDYPPGWKELADYLQVSAINCNGNAVTAEQIAEYLATERPVLAYTVNDPDMAIELLQCGVTGVFSDTPDVILEAIEDMAA